jgi:hypothetical protein
MCCVYPDLPGKHLYQCTCCKAVVVVAEERSRVDGTAVSSKDVGRGDEAARLEFAGSG